MRGYEEYNDCWCCLGPLSCLVHAKASALVPTFAFVPLAQMSAQQNWQMMARCCYESSSDSASGRISGPPVVRGAHSESGGSELSGYLLSHLKVS